MAAVGTRSREYISLDGLAQEWSPRRPFGVKRGHAVMLMATGNDATRFAAKIDARKSGNLPPVFLAALPRPAYSAGTG